MVYNCVNVRYKNGVPTVNTGEQCTFHVLAKDVVVPRRGVRKGDVVVIRTACHPIIKFVIGVSKSFKGKLSGEIVGKAAFYCSSNSIIGGSNENN